MKNDQYLKLEISLLTATATEQLIDRMGIEGWGIYVALLMKARQDDDLVVDCSEASLAVMARRWNTSPERVKAVTEDGSLFVPVPEVPGRFSSPYLDRVTAALWAKRGDVLRPRKSMESITVKQPVDGRFTVAPRASRAEKSRKEQSRG